MIVFFVIDSVIGFEGDFCVRIVDINEDGNDRDGGYCCCE